MNKFLIESGVVYDLLDTMCDALCISPLSALYSFLLLLHIDSTIQMMQATLQNRWQRCSTATVVHQKRSLQLVVKLIISKPLAASHNSPPACIQICSQYSSILSLKQLTLTRSHLVPGAETCGMCVLSRLATQLAIQPHWLLSQLV